MADFEDHEDVIPCKRAKTTEQSYSDDREVKINPLCKLSRSLYTAEEKSDGEKKEFNALSSCETKEGFKAGDENILSESIPTAESLVPTKSLASLDSKPSDTCGESLSPQSSEKDVGISEYVSKHIGFHAVLKQRYVDFLVNERDLKGGLVQLTSKSVPKEEKQDDNCERFLSDEERQKVQSVLESKDKTFYVTLGADDDKEHRTKMHHAIKKEFPTLDSETININQHKTVRVYRYQGNPARKRSDSWPADRGNYCRFVLYKENKDTMDTISLLSKLLRLKPGMFGYAGTKDKRAITVQEVRAYRVLAERLQGLNKTLKGIFLGNFEYCSEGLRLGQLSGNHFVITLRNVIGKMEDIEQAMTSLESVGFINYFGLQRFGTSSIPTHTIGHALLLSEWSKAIDFILSPKSGKPKDFNKALEHWKKTGDAKGAIERLSRQMCIEGYLLQGLVNHDNKDLVGALHMIPRNTRLMYVHAYQSYIWNNMVSRRIQIYGLIPIKGDLVIQGSTPADKGCSSMSEQLDDVMDLEEPESAEVLTAPSHSRPHVLSEEELESGHYSIHDIVMPLPGYDVIYPEYGAKEWYRELMAVDGIDIEHMRHRVKDYSLSGAYRHIIVKPKHTSWRLLRYNDVTQPLALTDLDRLEGRTVLGSDPDGKFLALQIELTLPPSCYATMAVREVLKCETSAASQSTLN